MSLKAISPIFKGTIVGIILFIIAFILFISFSKYNSGNQIRPYDQKELTNDYMKSLREDFNELLSNYSDQIKIVSSGFAVLAFLITYQAKGKVNVSKKAVGFLTTGVIMLVLSLMISLFGKELLYTMSARNSVDIGLLGLYISRLANYFSLIIAAVCFGFYAVELIQNISTSPQK